MTTSKELKITPLFIKACITDQLSDTFTLTITITGRRTHGIQIKKNQPVKILVFEETFMLGCFRAKTSGKLVKRQELGKDQTLEPFTTIHMFRVRN